MSDQCFYLLWANLLAHVLPLSFETEPCPGWLWMHCVTGLECRIFLQHWNYRCPTPNPVFLFLIVWSLYHFIGLIIFLSSRRILVGSKRKMPKWARWKENHVLFWVRLTWRSATCQTCSYRVGKRTLEKEWSPTYLGKHV